jgi:hypothetical protein
MGIGLFLIMLIDRSISLFLGFIVASVPVSALAQDQDRLKNVSFSTKGAIILMPCRDKSGNQLMGMTTENEFCTETFNQLVRDGGAKTVTWFKVNSELQRILDSGKKNSSSNPFLSGTNMGASRGDYTNDSYIPELIKAGKALGAKYVVRPVVLNKESVQSSNTKVSMGFMGFGAGARTESEKKANVTIKVDIIGVADQDIIGSKSFSGSISEKKTSGAGYELDRSGGAGGLDGPTRAAMMEAIYKAVEYVSERMN